MEVARARSVAARMLPLLGLVCAVAVLASTPFALAETQATPVAQASSSPDFGSPPSGQIPILYNDRHVYSKPDLLKAGRVLAAYVKGNAIYLPLRSMFEQMGATVAYDEASKTATVTKPGATITVTVGKPVVVINGESRPLDVPPVVYNGVVLVPVRVISESMGAYVQWVPDCRLVVVRYIPATPPPTEAPPPPVPEETVAPPPPPSPTPNPLTIGGYVRSFYFTRQNASNNPGTQFNFSPGAKYVSNGVNQASWNTGIAPHVDYDFNNSGWIVGGTYFYSNPINGPCVVPANHLKGGVCVTQTPPNTNSDDTLPGYTLSTADEAYLKYVAHGWNGTIGNQLFVSPWANPADSRLKPAAFEGGDLGYTSSSGWTVEGADMLAYENRTSSTFARQTLMTSYPSGNSGMASNIVVPGGAGIQTNGFGYGKVGYASPSGLSIDGYFYGVSDLNNMWWGDGKYAFGNSRWAPYIALQGGTNSNAGQSFIGKINSQVFGAQLGFTPVRGLLFTAGYDQIPWKSDTIFLPKGVTCSNANNQITATATLAYVLPLNAAQCFNNPNGTTQIEYGGWASPYTDNYDSDPLFTTSVTQGMADRRAAGTSFKAGLQYTTPNTKWIFIATDAWYNYGNALGPENTNIWVLDGRYRFSHTGKGPYHGLVLRDRYIQRTLSNTYCGAGGHRLRARFDDWLDRLRRSSALQVQPSPAGVRLLGLTSSRLRAAREIRRRNADFPRRARSRNAPQRHECGRAWPRSAGVYLGDDFLDAQPENPTGYWEDRRIVEINERLLKVLGLRWDDATPIAPREFEGRCVRALQRDAVRYLKLAFLSRTLWGFKDPRTVRLLPFWRGALSRCEVEDSYVVVIRNPRSVAASLFARQAMDAREAYRLWLVYMVPFLNEIIGKPSVVVDYDLLMADPRHELTRVERIAGAGDAREREIDRFATEFLNAELRHTLYARDDFEANCEAAALTQSAYLLLHEAATDQLPVQSPAFWTAWEGIAPG